MSVEVCSADRQVTWTMLVEGDDDLVVTYLIGRRWFGGHSLDRKEGRQKLLSLLDLRHNQRGSRSRPEKDRCWHREQLCMHRHEIGEDGLLHARTSAVIRVKELHVTKNCEGPWSLSGQEQPVYASLCEFMHALFFGKGGVCNQSGFEGFFSFISAEDITGDWAGHHIVVAGGWSSDFPTRHWASRAVQSRIQWGAS